MKIDSGRAAIKKEDILKACLDIALSEGNNYIWLYDIEKKNAQFFGGRHEFFKEGDIIPDALDTLLEKGWIHSDSKEMFDNMCSCALNDKRETAGMLQVKSCLGGYKWQKFIFSPFMVSEELPSMVLALSTDITDMEEVERQYYQEEHLRMMMSEDVIAVSRVNLTKNRIEYLWVANSDHQEAGMVKTYEQMFQIGYSTIVSAEDRKRYQKLFGLSEMLKGFQEGSNSISMEFRKKNADGNITWNVMTAALMQDPLSNDVKYYSTIRDIDEKKKLELSLREKAEKDLLTGIYNKITMESMIRESIQKYRTSRKECAMILMDVDDFKQVNDKYGHPFGDYVLAEIGRILKDLFGHHTMQGRMGGDEFAVFAKELPSQDWILEKVEKFIKSLHNNSHIHRSMTKITVSVGVAVMQHETAEFAALYEHADIALYNAKRHGKDRYELYGKQVRKTAVMEDTICPAKECLGKVCIMNAIEDIAFVTDVESYNLVYMNPAAQQAFGSVLEESKSAKCYEVIQGYPKPCPFCKDYKEDGDCAVWYNTNSRLDRHFYIKDKIIENNNKKYRLEFMYDAEQFGENDCAAMNKVLFDIIQILNCNESLHIIIRKVLRTMGDYYGSDRTYIMEKDKFEDTLSVSYEWCGQGLERLKDNMQNLHITALPRWTEKIERESVISIEFLEELKDIYPREYEQLKAQGIRTLYMVPFEVQEVLSGYIGVINPSANMGAIAFLRTIAFLTGLEIERRSLHENQNYMRNYDTLTGLLNRKSYLRAVQSIPVEAISSFGTVTADINGLKKINQENGIDYGDRLLNSFAKLLCGYFGKERVFRTAGDEFTVLCQDKTRDAFEEMVHALQVEIEGKYPNILSIGYSWADMNIDIDRMVRHAEEMMQVSKRRYYEQHKGHNSQGHQEIREKLLKNLAQHRYVIYLQPKAQIRTEQIKGAEALVRYRAEDGSIIGPGQFVPMLERQHLIRYIDMFVFEETCKLLNEWKRRGYELIPISLNFSRSTMLDESIIDEMNHISRRYQVPREYLEIEITESFGDVELETIKKIGNSIESNGYSLSLDDFGAMYSNISILSVLKLDVLKMDKCIVDELYTNRALKTIVENLIVSCHEIGIKCVAEGVETDEQLQILKEMNCDFAQGYLYNKPIPIDDFEQRYME